MNYIQYMKPGGNFWLNLGDAIKYARSTSTPDGGGAYYVTSQAKEDLREQGKEDEAKQIEKAETVGTVGGAIAGATITNLPTFILTMKWLGTPAGKNFIGNIGKDVLVGTAGYLATDEASKAMTGKTVGQQVADGLGKVGLEKVPYYIREGIGNFANPGGWLTWGGSNVANLLYMQGKNLIGKGILYVTPYAKSVILASKLNRLIRNTKLPQSLLNVTELHPHSRVKVGDVEVNDPTMMYRQGHLEIIDDFVDKGFVDRSWSPLDGSAAPQFAEGRLWYGLPKKSNRTGLLVTKQSMRPTDAATRENIPLLTTEGLATYVTDNVGRRIPMYDKLLTTSNTDAFVFKPNYGYLRINKSNPKTSLAFFERKPANITHAEKLGLTKHDRYGLGSFKSDLDWTAHKWMKDNIGGYNILDVMALQSHIPEYLKLELKFKGTTNWLKMRNGKTYIDDPRGWIQLLSKNGRIFDDSPIYTGVKTGVVDPNYNGIFWGTYDNGWISLYLARAYAPNDVSTLELVVPNNVKTYTQTHDGNTSWFALGGKEKPLLTNDVVETHFNNGIDRVNIRGIIDMGPNTGNIHSSKYNKLFDYTTHQGIIDEKFNAKFPQNDVIINLYVPRKSIIGNNGNFNLDDSNIYRKQGGSIKIKKKNIGSFTRYCKGKVTEKCIRKGKNSSNPTTRKRANFAANARKWKHEEGGKINYLNYFK